MAQLESDQNAYFPAMSPSSGLKRLMLRRVWQWFKGVQCVIQRREQEMAGLFVHDSIPYYALQKVHIDWWGHAMPHLIYLYTAHCLVDTKARRSSEIISQFYERCTEELVPVYNTSEVPMCIQLHGQEVPIEIAPKATIQVHRQSLIYFPTVSIPNRPAEIPRTRTWVACSFFRERSLQEPVPFNFRKAKSIHLVHDQGRGFKVNYQTIGTLQVRNGAPYYDEIDQERVYISWGVYIEGMCMRIVFNNGQEEHRLDPNRSFHAVGATVSQLIIQDQQGQVLAVITATSAAEAR